MLASDIKRIDAQARARFTYQADLFENWRSHADAVLRGEAWADDCDGLTYTVLDLLQRAGMAATDLWRMEVSSAKNGQLDHLIGCARTAAGEFWIVGDTFGPAYPAARLYHQPLSFMRLDLPPGAASTLGAPFR
jgi:hypothetical protein